nr:YetF domain-containing protein [Alkalihalobacterium elongatum]
MELDFIWKSVLLVLTGFLFLRVSGRKSIAQMTITTTIVMISIGAIIVQPIIEDSVLKTILSIGIFIGVLILIEYLQVKYNALEKLFTGKAISVIENGQVNLKNLKKIRLTIDKLEMQIRQNGISNITDINN